MRLRHISEHYLAPELFGTYDVCTGILYTFYLLKQGASVCHEVIVSLLLSVRSKFHTKLVCNFETALYKAQYLMVGDE